MNDSTIGGAWIQNPEWAGIEDNGLRLVHGMLTKRPGSSGEGKSPLSESIAKAERDFADLLSAGPGSSVEEESSRTDRLSRIKLIAGDQVHGTDIAVITDDRDLDGGRKIDASNAWVKAYYEFGETDALVSSVANHLLLVQTADCLPILFRYGGTPWAVATCHCGWRGLLAGLAGKTAEAILDRGGGGAESVEAWIAPGICVDHYEVSAELVEKFQNAYPEIEASPDGRLLDLARVAVAQLVRAGLSESNIMLSGGCTFEDSAKYHSYRRDGEKTGRLLTVIGMIEG